MPHDRRGGTGDASDAPPVPVQGPSQPPPCSYTPARACIPAATLFIASRYGLPLPIADVVAMAAGLGERLA